MIRCLSDSVGKGLINSNTPMSLSMQWRIDGEDSCAPLCCRRSSGIVDGEKPSRHKYVAATIRVYEQKSPW